jgi:hypothetical protein
MEKTCDLLKTLVTSRRVVKYITRTEAWGKLVKAYIAGDSGGKNPLFRLTGNALPTLVQALVDLHVSVYFMLLFHLYVFSVHGLWCGYIQG